MEAELLDNFAQMSKYLYAFIKIGIIGTLCLVIYTCLNLAMKMEYASELTKRVMERLKK